MGKKKDFDIERIDKILAQFPDEDEAAGAKPKPSAAKPALPAGSAKLRQSPGTRQPERPPRTPIGPWIRVAAGVVLALAITQWPYARACGLGFFLYLAAIAGSLAVGVWAAIHTWRSHLPVPFVTAQAVVLWCLALGMFQILPRVGYAKAEAGWMCPLPPATQAPVAAPTPVPSTPQMQPDAIPADSPAADSAAVTRDSVAAADSIPGEASAGRPDSAPATTTTAASRSSD